MFQEQGHTLWQKVIGVEYCRQKGDEFQEKLLNLAVAR